jgi:DnaK suppressor protein
MNTNKYPFFQAKLEDIRSGLVGDVEKVIKSTQEDMSEPAADITDGAAQAYYLQLMLELGEQDSEKLKQVDAALKKINTGHYGTCPQCENSIPEKRLEVVPYAEYCVDCLSEIEKETASEE